MRSLSPMHMGARLFVRSPNSDIETLVDVLPSRAAQVVREVAQRSKLWHGERKDVVEELVSHFVEGLECGVSVDELIAQFGEPDETGALIRKAKRRCRPIAWKSAYAAMISVSVVVALLAGAYLSRAATLYLRSSSTGNGMSAAAVAPVVDETKKRWQVETASVDKVAAETFVLEKDALDAVQAGASDDFQRAIIDMYSLAEQLRAERSIAGEVQAANIELAASNLLSGAATAANLDFDADMAVTLEEILTRRNRLVGVRTAFDRLLDDMYTKNFQGDGHLTGTGIEMVRLMKNWHQPSFKDRLMEPVWYALPASRREVEQRFEEAVRVAELTGREIQIDGSALTLLESISSSMWECLRYPAISAVLPQLATVFAASEEANRARAKAMLTLQDRPTI